MEPENSADIEIHYRDHGAGKPIVLIHGYRSTATPRSARNGRLLQAGYRCISYDHLGLGEDVVLAGFSARTCRRSTSRRSSCTAPDRILPFEWTAARLRDENLIADLTVVEIPNGPHNVGWTFPEECNKALLDFLKS